MKCSLLLFAAALLFASAAQAQVTSPIIPPGKIAVFKGGDGSTTWSISSSKAQPCFVQIFDPATLNQASPLLSVTLPTNGTNAIWINAHAGSEGGGIALAANREYLALEGYSGNIIAPTAAKPSSDATVLRGICTLDAFTNVTHVYSDTALWFGMPTGVTQNNPTGIASTDGTNFWGTGSVTGSNPEASGTLFFNGVFPAYGGLPVVMQSAVQSANQMRIISNTLYLVIPGGGVYDFVDPSNANTLVPLPFDPNVSNPVEHTVKTNLVFSWGSSFTKVSYFDMNRAGTIAYGADQSAGIVKFVNTAGVWAQAPYFFSSTNLGTTTQSSGNKGCFGICVDFTGANPVIYATTMENGNNNNVGNANQNRLIRIVDTGSSPGSNVVAQTLATALTTNENFRGIDFTPNLQPLITAPPANASTTNNGSATFTVTADSVFAVNYQWLQNGTNLVNQTNVSVLLSNLQTNFNGFTYQCIVSNQYGAVTSTPPAVLTVSFVAQPPVITNGVASVTNFGGSTETFGTITPTGTQPFTFQWYFSTNLLVDDGIHYSGSTTAALSISNLTVADAGNYSLVVSNSAGVASNVVDMLTVAFQLPTIKKSGQPQSVIAFAGTSVPLTVTPTGGTPPLLYQWFQGTTALTNTNEFSGVTTGTLTIDPASFGDAADYTVVITNGAGSVTSSVATVTILAQPALSAVAYSNQVYTQNFDSLPDPGTDSINSFNNPTDAGALNGLAYSLANPFDFTFPVITNSFIGGLGLSNAMPGWYGASDTLLAGVDGISRFGAQDGDQTAGGVIDFGLNDGGTIPGTNRALGLLSTSSTGSSTFALKLVNQSANNLTNLSISFIGELWRQGTNGRTMQFGYAVDPTATSFALTAQSISNSTLVPGLAFSFPTGSSAANEDGTQSSNQVVLATNNLPLASAWQPGAALWLIWSIDYNGSGGGNGYAIDNLTVSTAGSQPVIIGSRPSLGGVTYSSGAGASFSFTNTPGASFTVYATTNLTPPITWTSLGSPTETANGAFSTYRFTDAQTNNARRFYKVTSP